MQNYRIQLETYSGPMDLLLYLIRREEVDIYDIPIARILGQYLEYVRVLESLDPEMVGDFLVMAATLMEIKSRMLLPKNLPEEDDSDDGLDPRADLVRQLLAYRSFREAAGHLEHRAEVYSRRFGRPPVDVPEERQDVDLEDVQIWDLLKAFNKLMSVVGSAKAFHEVKYDDTPITLHATDIADRLEREGGSLRFSKIFEGRSRPQMIGLFLALLELIRQKRVRVEQGDAFGEIDVHLIDATPITQTADDELEEKERQADDDAPLDEEPDYLAEPGPAGLDDEDDDDDEYTQRLKAIEIGEVDLGRVSDGPLDGDPETGETTE